ncbi:MAG TPA: hypothetical protein VFW25_10345 [Silvibacterium sp.]|nr:hypothetical protein [Silvibacterium sp.]
MGELTVTFADEALPIAGVAVTVQEPGTSGAVYSPVAETDPQEVDHVALGSALNCCVAPSVTIAEGGEIPVPLVPVPESDTVSGVALLLLVMLHEAVSGATIVGVNAMLTAQLADAARLEPQVVDVTAKSAAFVPEIPAELRVTAFAVVFETVTVCEVLVDASATLP